MKTSLDTIVDPTAKDDPMSPLRWTPHSNRHLADLLKQQGFDVSKSQVCQLLHEMEYQLAANRKSLEDGTNPNQNAQFEFINEQSKKFLKRKDPEISVDAKNKGQGNRKIQHPFSCSLRSWH